MWNRKRRTRDKTIRASSRRVLQIHSNLTRTIVFSGE